MLSAYPACFIKEGSGYSVIFPDLNYTATCGDTLEDAFAMAIECLAGYLYTAKTDGDPLPEPSALEDVSYVRIAKELDLNPSAESFVNMVTVDVKEYAKKHFEKPVKKTLSIPAWLNDRAIQANINFSQLLQKALKKELHLQ